MKVPRLRTYKLVGHDVVPCELLESILARCERIDEGHDGWRVALDKVGDRAVSTMFLGMDMNPFDGEPQLFETAIFTKDKPVEIVGRCATWEQAEAQHAEALRSVRRVLQ